MKAICVQAGFSARDEKIAGQLHRGVVRLEQMVRAALLG